MAFYSIRISVFPLLCLAQDSPVFINFHPHLSLAMVSLKVLLGFCFGCRQGHFKSALHYFENELQSDHIFAPASIIWLPVQAGNLVSASYPLVAFQTSPVDGL